jgi:hypothetical protein
MQSRIWVLETINYSLEALVTIGVGPPVLHGNAKVTPLQAVLRSRHLFIIEDLFRRSKAIRRARVIFQTILCAKAASHGNGRSCSAVSTTCNRCASITECGFGREWQRLTGAGAGRQNAKAIRQSATQNSDIRFGR